MVHCGLENIPRSSVPKLQACQAVPLVEDKYVLHLRVDNPNIIIAGATGLNFVDFIVNLWMPILAVTIFTLLVFGVVYRKHLKPIAGDLIELMVANIIIRKIRKRFVKKTIHLEFVLKVLGILFLTFLGFIIQKQLGLPNYLIALSAAVLLAILTRKRININHMFESVEWPTLFFFAGLFIMVGGIEHVGLLDKLSGYVANSTSNVLYLSLLILWVSGIVSMILDNIPFVTVMIPVIFGIQAKLPGVDTTILWWALSLGACLGGNGTIIGASANVVSAGLAKKEGIEISFLNYMKFSLPLTLGILIICSGYLFITIS